MNLRRALGTNQQWRWVVMSGAAIVLLSGCSNSAQSLEQQPDAPMSSLSVAAAQSEESAAAAQPKEDVLEAMRQADVIYLAETHTSVGDHRSQLEIMQTLADAGPVTIGMEMFQRPFDRYLALFNEGAIDETSLIEETEYERRWGFDWELYAPIVRYAQENQLPLIALNTPTEITRKVAIEGLASLSGDDFEYIPPLEEIDTSNEDYQALIRPIFGAHGAGGHGHSGPSFENFFAAQVLWDETMAEAIAEQLAAEPDRQVIVLVGEGHVAYDFGIPSRVERRLPDVSQVSVRLVDADAPVDEGFADFVWVNSDS